MTSLSCMASGSRRFLRSSGKAPQFPSHNRYKFNYQSKSGTLALRLPDDVREAFLKKYKTTPCKQ
jgi:hypothetical protein